MKKLSYIFLMIGYVMAAHTPDEQGECDNSFFQKFDKNGNVIAVKTPFDKYVHYFTKIPDNVSPYDYYAENWKDDIFPKEYFNKLLDNRIPTFKSDVKRDITDIERRKLQMFVFICFRTRYEWLRTLIHYDPQLIQDKSNIDERYYCNEIIYKLLENFVLFDCSLDFEDIIDKANSMYMYLYGVGEMFPNFQPYSTCLNTWPFQNIDFISKLTKESLIEFEKYLKNYNMHGVWQEYYGLYNQYQDILNDNTKEDADHFIEKYLHEIPEEQMKLKYFFVKLVKDIIKMVY